MYHPEIIHDVIGGKKFDKRARDSASTPDYRIAGLRPMTLHRLSISVTPPPEWDA